MKKFLPIIIIVVAIAIFAFVFIKVRGQKSTEGGLTDDTETAAEIPFDQRPFTSLTPKSDGHWLTLEIKNIKLTAATVDYELIYKTKQGTTQGVPGTIKMEGKDIKRDLLLGSESSGKFRYDEGVEEGSFSLRFRNDKGKLVGKLTTDFHMQSNTDTLSTLDKSFSFKLDKKPAKTFFLTMNTFGIDGKIDFTPKSGPIGLFGSDATKYSGKIENGDGAFYLIENQKATKIETGAKTNIGVFVSQ